MAGLTALGAIKSTFAVQGYRDFFIGGACSNIGTWVQRIAIGWLTWEFTESGTWLGIIAMADLFPTVVLAPLAGAVADRVERLWLTKLFAILAMAQAVILSALAFAGYLDIWSLAALALFHGLVQSFNMPVRFAIVPSLVAREHMSAAIALNSMNFNLARFVGPAIGGIIIVNWGANYSFAVNAVSYLAFLVALSRIRLTRTEQRTGRRFSYREIPSDVATAFGYAVRHPGIGPLLAMLTVIALFARPYMELLPGFAAEVFGRGADGLGWLTSMVGLGAVTGAFFLARRGAVLGLTAITVTNLLLFACALIAFSSTTNFPLGLVCAVVTGFAMIITGVGEQTLVQNAVEGELRGRVMSLYGMISRGGPAVGALIMGIISGWTGLQWPVTGGAVICLGLWIWAKRRQRAMAEHLEADSPA